MSVPAPQRDKQRPAVFPTRAPAAGWAATASAIAPAAVAAAAMAALGWWGIARRGSMSNDEVATRWAALLSLRELAHLLRYIDAVHGLYYLLMHGWMAVGTSPAIMRVPSVIAMAVAAALIVIIGRRLTGSGWAGLFAGLIMVLTPSISYYAQTARSYAMVFACVLGSTLALIYALEAEAAGGPGGQGGPGEPGGGSGRRRPWLGRRWLIYGGLVALGGYLNEMSLLVLAAHAVTVLLARYGRPAFERWAVAAAGGTALVAPLLVVSILQHGSIGWIAPPSMNGLRLLIQDYLGVQTVAAAGVAFCAVIALLPAPGSWRRRPEQAWWRSGGVSLPSVAAPLLVLPAAILLIESRLLHPLYVDRYVLYGEAGAALLAGAGLYRIGRWLSGKTGWRVLLWAPGVIVCVCVLVLQLTPQHHIRLPGSRSYDYGGASRYVGAHARPGDGIIFFGKYFRKARLAYPGDFKQTSDFTMAVSPLQAGDLQGDDKPFSATLPLMLGYRRIWVYGGHPLERHQGLLRDESIALRQHFIRIGGHRFRGILVTLWQRR